MLPILHRTTRVMTLGSVENDVNLASKMGNPSESLNALFFNNANKSASNTGTPAVRTGATWKPGSSVYLRNTAIIGGATGTTGSAGSTGGQGAGGAGGTGGNANITSAGAPGSSGGTGGVGGTGGPGGAGGPCFTADTVSGVRILVDNTATLNGGSGGAGGTGGSGGPGGGGGGGGGGVRS